MSTKESLFYRAAELLESWAPDAPSHDWMGTPALIAELRAAAQQSALDELVRENERLGLYDDQKPAQETKCACSPDMYVAGYTGGAAPEGLFGKLYVYIEGASRSVEYAPVAAPAPAQSRQPLSEWIACDDRLPDNNTHCFVVGPRFNDYRRGQYTAEALFIDGKFFSHDEGDDLYTPSHWFPIPTLPAAPERAITGEKP